MGRLEQLQKTTWIRIGAVAGVLILTLSPMGRFVAGVGDRILGDIFSPVLSLTGRGASHLRSFGHSLVHVGSLEKENRVLTQEVARLEEENRKLSDIIGRSELLRSEAKLRSASPHPLIKARITGVDEGYKFSSLSIDRGTRHGVKLGATVVVGLDGRGGVIVEGLVGKVVEVGDNWAKVQSIFSEGAAVSVRNIRTQDGGVLRGQGKELLLGFTFDPYADVVANDRLMSAGIGDVFAGGIFVGTVTEVHRDEKAMTQEMKVRPAVNFKRLSQVFVLGEESAS